MSSSVCCLLSFTSSRISSTALSSSLILRRSLNILSAEFSWSSRPIVQHRDIRKNHDLGLSLFELSLQLLTQVFFLSFVINPNLSVVRIEHLRTRRIESLCIADTRRKTKTFVSCRTKLFSPRCDLHDLFGSVDSKRFLVDSRASTMHARVVFQMLLDPLPISMPVRTLRRLQLTKHSGFYWNFQNVSSFPSYKALPPPLESPKFPCVFS